MVKFNKSLQEYNCILSFDLAKIQTGFSFYDFKNNIVLHCGTINMGKIEEQNIYKCLYEKFKEIIKEVKNTNIPFFVTKEKLPNQAGNHSTIKTLQELAKVHAIFDLVVLLEEVDYYDLDGIHSVSVKNFFKKITNIEKPSKEDIQKVLLDRITCPFVENFSLDASDSLAVSVTLINSKWNKDIEEEQKELKKQIKKFKSDKKISELQSRIDFLQKLKEIKNEQTTKCV